MPGKFPEAAVRRPVALFVGLRYLQARSGSRFVSFVALTSVIGVTLGVAALIVVLSVMNGFENELRGRLLSMTSHASIYAKGGLLNWQSIVRDVRSDPEIDGAAPYIEIEGMLASGGVLAGAIITGIAPALEPEVSEVAQHMQVGSFADLEPGSLRILLGRSLALQLGVARGDSVTVLVPQPLGRTGGVTSRLRRYIVAGIFELGLRDHDSVRALVHLSDAAELAQLGDRVSGVRVRAGNIFSAPRVIRAWAEGHIDTGGQIPDIRDWTQDNASYFRAIRIEKTMMTLLLSLIIGVAAFNIVATLVMVVTEKRAGIAILRTLGYSPGNIVGIFVLQGTIIGWLGGVSGIVLGVVMALNIDILAPMLESWFGFQFMPADLYYLTELPADLHTSDVVWTAVIVFLMTTLATIYPARRAAGVEPAEVLRYE